MSDGTVPDNSVISTDPDARQFIDVGSFPIEPDPWLQRKRYEERRAFYYGKRVRLCYWLTLAASALTCLGVVALYVHFMFEHPWVALLGPAAAIAAGCLVTWFFHAWLFDLLIDLPADLEVYGKTR